MDRRFQSWMRARRIRCESNWSHGPLQSGASGRTEGQRGAGCISLGPAGAAKRGNVAGRQRGDPVRVAQSAGLRCGTGVVRNDYGEEVSVYAGDFGAWVQAADRRARCGRSRGDGRWHYRRTTRGQNTGAGDYLGGSGRAIDHGLAGGVHAMGPWRGQGSGGH